MFVGVMPRPCGTARSSKTLLFRIGELVTKARCIGSLFSLGIAFIVVGSICMSWVRARKSGDTEGNQDPLVSTGLLLLTLGSLFLFTGMSIAIYACCFYPHVNEQSTSGRLEIAHICIPTDDFSDPPPPYPGRPEEEEPPPPYPANTLSFLP